jgi:GNAT superfamily N-acetyltransferase
MDITRFIIETQPTRQDVDFLKEQINSYNIKQTSIDFGGHLACFLRDDDGDIVAGLYGYIWGDCCQIEALWVQADLRSQGYGTRLLQLAEQEALNRGCTQVVLDTHSFQAPVFYQMRGYEIVGVVDGYPRPGYQKIYLKKQLRSALTPSAEIPD